LIFKKGSRLSDEGVGTAIGQKKETPWSSVRHSAFLGSREFMARIKEHHIGGDKSASDIPALKSSKSRPSIEELQKDVENQISLKPSVIKQLSLFLCQRYSGKKLKEIGDYFSVGESGVSQAARRVQDRVEVDKEFGNIVEEIGRRFRTYP
jgi:hypothetical protein